MARPVFSRRLSVYALGLLWGLSVALVPVGPGHATPEMARGVTPVAENATCGDPNGDGEFTAGDALFVLQVSVGTRSCPIPVCDASGDNQILVSDALRILLFSVGIGDPLVCGAGTTTSTTTTTTSSTTSTSSTTTTSTRTTSTSTTSTTLPVACPEDGPLLDLRDNCSHLLYLYSSPFERAGLATNGRDVVVIIEGDNPTSLALMGEVFDEVEFDYDSGCELNVFGQVLRCFPLTPDIGRLESDGTVLAIGFEGRTVLYGYDGVVSAR